MWNILSISRLFGKVAKKPLRILEEHGFHMLENPYSSTVIKEDELLELIDEVDILIVGPDRITEKMIDRAERLKIIAVQGVGFDNIDLNAATAKGVYVTNAPGTNAESVAELVFTMILALCRRINYAHQSIMENNWKTVVGYEVYGKTLGLVGFGSIGKAVAKRAVGFSLDTIVYDPYINEKDAAKYSARVVSFEELISSSDFISLHTPLTKETKGIIGEREFSLMKNNAILINTARGPLVETESLIHSLKTGRIAGAGLDVFDPEPPVASLFEGLTNIITSPHMGAFTYEALERVGMVVVDNILACYQGTIPPNLVNKKVLKEGL